MFIPIVIYRPCLVNNQLVSLNFLVQTKFSIYCNTLVLWYDQPLHHAEDTNMTRKNKWLGQGIIVSMTLIAFLFVEKGFYQITDGVSNIAYFLIYVMIILALLVCIVLHEVGHLIFGKLLGYTLLSFSFLFISWKSENGFITLKLVRKKGYAGACAMISPQNPLSVPKRILYYTGGILFSGLITIGIMIILFLLPGMPVFLYLFLAAIVFFSIVLNVANLVPFESCGNSSDGKIIWNLLCKRSYSKQLRNTDIYPDNNQENRIPINQIHLDAAP